MNTVIVFGRPIFFIVLIFDRSADNPVIVLFSKKIRVANRHEAAKIRTWHYLVLWPSQGCYHFKEAWPQIFMYLTAIYITLTNSVLQGLSTHGSVKIKWYLRNFTFKKMNHRVNSYRFDRFLTFLSTWKNQSQLALSANKNTQLIIFGFLCADTKPAVSFPSPPFSQTYLKILLLRYF